MLPPRPPDLASLLEALPLGAYVFHLEDPARADSLRITFANTGSAKALGVEPSSVVGTLIGDHFPEALNESRNAAIYRDAIVEQTPRDLGIVQQGGTGERFAVSVHPIGPETAVVLFENVTSTEAHNMELAAIIATSEDAIVTRTMDGLVTSWNVWAERLFGYSAEEMIGNPIDAVNVAEPFQGGTTVEELREALHRGERPKSFETRMRRKDGTTVDVSVATSPIKDPSGRITGVAGVIRDLTEQRRLEVQLRQAQKLESIGSLAGGVAHDFNNILTVIRSASDILLNEIDDEALRGRAQQIGLAAEHAAALTGQLLAFSRQQVLRPEPSDLNAIVEATLGLVERLIGEQISVVRELAGDLAPIHVDRSQLQQVIMNLGINARDAMPNGGTLAVRTSNVVLGEHYAAAHPDVAPGPYVELEITDSGVGMNTDTVARIFDPFFTTKPEGRGTGLGLATVHGIVKQSGGHIWVYSEEGRGTTFKVYLPPSDSTAVVREPAPTDVESLDGDETILVVEDNEMLRPLIVDILSDYSYTVLEAANGVAALAVADGHPGPIDLLLTDVVMPEMNGGELSERLLAKHPAMKVLFSSGYPADSVVRAGIEEARVAFIQKPYVGVELLTKIRSMLNVADR